MIVGQVRKRVHATPAGKRLIAFLALIFVSGVLGGPVSSLLSVYVDSALRQPPTFTSTLLAFQLATTGLFALLSGAIADGLGQKRTLVLGLFGIPLATTIFILHSFWFLAVVVVSLGATNALQAIGGQSYLLAASPPAKLGAFTALYFLGSTLGGAVGNLLVGPSADRWGFGAVGLVGLVLSVVLLAVTSSLLPEAPATARIRRPTPLELLSTYAKLIRRRDVALVCVIRLLPTCFYGTTSLLIPLLIYRLSQSVTFASIYATTSLLLSTTSQQVVGRILDRVGAFATVRVLAGLLPIIALATALAAQNLPALFVTGIIATSVLWGLSTTIPPLVRDVAPGEAQGRALGLVHLVWSTGMLIGTVTGGALVTTNPHLPFAVFALGNLLTFPAAFVLARRRSAQSAGGDYSGEQ